MHKIILILNKQIQIGKSEIPIVLFIPFFLILVSFFFVQISYFKKYNEVVSFLKKYYPEIYEQKIRRKPDFGRFYSTAYDYSKPLIELAKSPEIINDSRANNILSEFVEFDRKLNWIVSVVAIIGMLSIFVIAIASKY
jgi:hypothetical protein